MSYKYKVSVTGAARYLDAQGFLMDNLILRDHFVNSYESGKKKADSCERMACSVIRAVRKYCRDNNVPHVSRIYVEIWGSDTSFIVAEWNQ